MDKDPYKPNHDFMECHVCWTFLEVLALCRFLCQAGSGHGSSGEAGGGDE